MCSRIREVKIISLDFDVGKYQWMLVFLPDSVCVCAFVCLLVVISIGFYEGANLISVRETDTVFEDLVYLLKHIQTLCCLTLVPRKQPKSLQVSFPETKTVDSHKPTKFIWRRGPP